MFYLGWNWTNDCGTIPIDGDWDNVVSEDDLIFLQYTGLKDRNGKEIYEGDMLDIQLHTPALVVWHEKFASFALERKGWMFSHWFGESVNPEETTIIGNIYDNPSLLEAK